MSSTTVLHTYRFKRGKEDAINRLNPLLDAGEPIVVYCNDGMTRIKMGDGESNYSELNFIGEQETTSCIFSAKSIESFPKKGDENVIYKDSSNCLLYQWNEGLEEYEIVGGSAKADYVSLDRDPTTEDVNYEVLSYWVNTDNDNIFLLRSVRDGVANWLQLNVDIVGLINDTVTPQFEALQGKIKQVYEDIKMPTWGTF